MATIVRFGSAAAQFRLKKNDANNINNGKEQRMDELPTLLRAKNNSRILIEATSISKKMSGRNLISNVDFRIEENEIVTLIGPNGCGKTTLLRCLLGLTRPDGGKISRMRNLRVGYVPQHIHFDPSMPITAEYFLNLKADKFANLLQISELLQINDLLQKQLRNLSGGELQRVLLAQALLNTPQLLVLDEPVQGVDFSGQASLYKLIRNASKTLGCSVIMVSHDLHLVMADTDRVVCLNGHICCSGTPQNVSKDPAFRNLFGEDIARQIALYVHHHDHHHNASGDVVTCEIEGHNHG